MGNQVSLVFLENQVCLVGGAHQALLVLMGRMVMMAKLACLGLLALQGHRGHPESLVCMELRGKKVQQEPQVNMVKMGLLELQVQQAQTARKERLVFLACLVPMEMQGRTVTVISRSPGSSRISRYNLLRLRPSSSSFNGAAKTETIQNRRPVKSGLSKSSKSMPSRSRKKSICI